MSPTSRRMCVVASSAIATLVALAVGPVVTANAASVTIASIQGTGSASPLAGTATPVTTEGFVTAVYATGGFNGYYIQTSGTGGAIDITKHRASDGLFVYSTATAASVKIGDFVRVTGKITEYNGLTEITVTSKANLEQLDPKTGTAPTPATVTWPGADADRETLEGMLLQPQGDFTVSDVHESWMYAQLTLAAGSTPPVAPGVVGKVGSTEYKAAQAALTERSVLLDDGSSVNYSNPANGSIPSAYISTVARVGSPVTFTRPVILDYRSSAWRLQPTVPITQTNESAEGSVVFGDTRTPAPRDVGGTARIATFNVQNYFVTTGDMRTGCTFYTDRAGTPITVNDSSAPGCGVRGAATAASFARQQAKIVNAILALDADIVSLEELQNGAKVGLDRDIAIANLVVKLNEKVGYDAWKYVPSPAALPPLADQDVIRTGFIYRDAWVEPVGDSTVLTGSAPFSNAREPEAQAFKPKWGDPDETFLVISNHFKSRGSEGATGDNVDRGQGSYNGDRTRQAQALLDFSAAMQTKAGTDKVFIVGDFNAYDKEDPLLKLAAAGYSDLGATTGHYSYTYDGAVGSLDHAFASASALSLVKGTDIWNVNSYEQNSGRFGYYNYNVVNMFNPKTPYAASDHDPIVIGVELLRHTPPIIVSPPAL